MSSDRMSDRMSSAQMMASSALITVLTDVSRWKVVLVVLL